MYGKGSTARPPKQGGEKVIPGKIRVLVGLPVAALFAMTLATGCAKEASGGDGAMQAAQRAEAAAGRVEAAAQRAEAAANRAEQAAQRAEMAAQKAEAVFQKTTLK
jgi:hypothetical protein